MFALRCGEAGQQLGFGPKQRETELKWKSQGWRRSTHTHACPISVYQNEHTWKINIYKYKVRANASRLFPI